MKEVISVNLGQAGVQVSNAAWELFCIEHGIRADGSRIDSLEDADEHCDIFFHRLDKVFVPRVITVDFEPTVIDEIRVGAYRQLFHPSQLISGCEDCANNFARGNYTVGKIYLKTVMTQIVKLVENCDGLQGFFLLNSFDGGTGSGFSACLEEALSFQYGKVSNFQLGIYPSRRMATSIVYPYNAILHAHATMENTDLSMFMDNEAIYNICSNKLNILRPSYSNINRIIAQLFSSVTVSMRFKNFLNSDMNQICTNLIPYPRIHFPLSHFAPLLGLDKIDKEPYSILDITRDIFDPDNQLVQCDTKNGKFMSCVLQFRGFISPNEVNKSITEIKGRTDVQFVDWCPTGFKLGINNKPLANPPGSSLGQIQKSLTMLSNTSAIVETWSDILRKFQIMFSKKAFIHWFIGEGLEEGEFTEAYENIKLLERDYFEITLPSNNMTNKGKNFERDDRVNTYKQSKPSESSKESMTKEHMKEKSKTKKSMTKESKTNKSMNKDSKTKELLTKESKTKKSMNKDSKTKEPITKKSKIKKSMTNESMTNESKTSDKRLDSANSIIRVLSIESPSETDTSVISHKITMKIESKNSAISKNSSIKTRIESTNKKPLLTMEDSKLLRNEKSSLFAIKTVKDKPKETNASSNKDLFDSWDDLTNIDMYRNELPESVYNMNQRENNNHRQTLTFDEDKPEIEENSMNSRRETTTYNINLRRQLSVVRQPTLNQTYSKVKESFEDLTLKRMSEHSGKEGFKRQHRTFASFSKTNFKDNELSKNEFKKFSDKLNLDVSLPITPDIHSKEEEMIKTFFETQSYSLSL